jgi:hypothetical protein
MNLTFFCKLREFKKKDRSGITASSFLRRIFLSLSFVIALSGCLVETQPPIITPTPAVTNPIPSATFAYPTMPATATHTAEPSRTPTPDPLSGLGAVLFEDDFSVDRGWDLSQQQQGAISISSGRLVIAVRTSQSFLFSLAPNLTLSNFFLEVDIRADLCQPGDEFGVIFRMSESHEHYRFSINCEGESRMVRVLSGESRTITPLSDFPFIRSGTMASNHLSLKAIGDTFQSWINGFEVFSIRDIALTEGAVGLFVRSGRGSQATISFDNVTVREVLNAATPDLTPTP